jgi:hypothetical protein
VIVDQLVEQLVASGTHKPKPKPPPTFPKPTPDNKHHPLGPNNPSVFVPIIPIPSPDKPIPGPLPYENAGGYIITRYRLLENWVHFHASHVYVVEDIIPDRATVVDWLKKIKQMKNIALGVMKNCTTTTDIRTAEVMMQWLKQLRTNIGNIGRVAAARAGTLPPMDDIHTDDDMPQASISRKSHSKTASRSLLDTTAHPKRQPLLYKWNNHKWSPWITARQNPPLEETIQVNDHPILSSTTINTIICTIHSKHRHHMHGS